MSEVSSGNPPAAIYVAGRDEEQVLVTVWQDGSADIAFRDAGESWGPPIQMERRPVR